MTPQRLAFQQRLSFNNQFAFLYTLATRISNTYPILLAVIEFMQILFVCVYFFL